MKLCLVVILFNISSRQIDSRYSAIFTFVDLTTPITDPVKKYSTHNFPTRKLPEQKFQSELYLEQMVRFDFRTIDNFLSLKESRSFNLETSILQM